MTQDCDQELREVQEAQEKARKDKEQLDLQHKALAEEVVQEEEID